jgi:excisionase family DNA binding protein
MSANTPKTITVPEAGRRYFGIGRDSSYAAAKAGQIPVIKIGRLWRVPIAAVERMLETTSRKVAK